MKLYRQGDVLLRQVSKLPAKATSVKNEGRIVLAQGEVTGHAHAIDAAEAEEFTMDEAAGAVRRFLKVFSLGGTVRHEEHAAIPLPVCTAHEAVAWTFGLEAETYHPALES